jgi:hypothetical protein
MHIGVYLGIFMGIFFLFVTGQENYSF